MIKSTPNNPESSRAHLFIVLKYGTQYFTIIDMGQFDREYDPIRISFDERISRKHERIMTMTPEIEDYVVSAVNGDPIEE